LRSLSEVFAILPPSRPPSGVAYAHQPQQPASNIDTPERHMFDAVH